MLSIGYYKCRKTDYKESVACILNDTEIVTTTVNMLCLHNHNNKILAVIVLSLS